MCGIYGTNKRYTKEVFDKKLQSMNHRGPDFQSWKKLNDFSLTFGQVRLSIIDLDSRSNQPFTYGAVEITFNGEIYNFLELKNDLITKGYQFTTTSDTEVICALYMDKGPDCVKYLNGMFAFVIYDSKLNLLFGARDRIGQKPLYYSLKDNEFEFASQLTPIRIGNKLNIDRTAIREYLEWGYVPEPSAIYEDVYKLKAGYSFTYDLSQKIFNTREYWSLPSLSNSVFDYEESVNQLDGLINDSVRRRMIADVPVGVFLSGGVDSSLIAALAQKNSTDTVKTFSVGFEESGFDETKYAKKVAELLGTNHSRIVLSSNEGIGMIESFNDYFDEPFFDTSALGQMILSKETARSVTVALSGDGGDELFLGYGRYKTVQSKQFVYKVPYQLRQLLAKLYRLYGNKRSDDVSAALLLSNIEDYYAKSMMYLNRDWLNFDTKITSPYISLLYSEKNILERISDFDIKTYLNGDILTKVDRGSMKYSLEARSPLLDYRVVEFSRSIPTDFKYKKGNGKRILKEVLYKYLPKELFDRKKSGFSIPVGVWFRNELKDYVYNQLTFENLALIPEINAVNFLKLVDQHMANTHNHYLTIWKVLILIDWINRDAKIEN